MRVIAKKNISSFILKHSNCKAHLEAWYAEAKVANWKSPNDVIDQYSKASLIGKDRVVFRKGDDYRLVVRINYAVGIIYVCFIGTHSEYDKIDAETVWKY